MDDDVLGEGWQRQQAPRQGRRAAARGAAAPEDAPAASTAPAGGTAFGALDATQDAEPERSAAPPAAQPAAQPTAAKGGWGAPALDLDQEGPKFTGQSRRKAEGGSLFAGGDDAADGGGGGRRRNRHTDDADSGGVDTIMEIPELEADEEEDFTRQVAAPPKAPTNRVQTITELNEAAQFSLPNQDKEIDLSLLTAVLCPAESIQEPDESWTPDCLLQEVASDLLADEEALMNDDDAQPGEDTAHGGATAPQT